MKSMKRTWMVVAAGLLALWAAAQGGGFRFDGPMNRVLTPNGDGRNDTLVFCFGNPADSEVEARIYTLLGSEVARVSARQNAAGICPPAPLNMAQQLIWDGKQDGRTVASGVYVYRVQSEGQTFSGSVVVVR